MKINYEITMEKDLKVERAIKNYGILNRDRDSATFDEIRLTAFNTF